MTACTCRYDRDADAYAHVCAFHVPSLRRDAHGWRLVGRRVSPAAVIEVGADGEATPVPLEVIDRATGDYARSLDAGNAVKRAMLPAAEPPPTPNRAERRRRARLARRHAR